MTRQIKRLVISPNLLLGACRTPYRIKDNALPDDVKVVGTYLDEHKQLFNLIVESKTFESVPDGEPIPEVEPVVFERLPTVAPCNSE